MVFQLSFDLTIFALCFEKFYLFIFQATYEDRKTKRREARIRDGLPPTANAGNLSLTA